MAETVNVYYTGNGTNKVEIPLQYTIDYMYDGVNGDLIGTEANPGIKLEILEKIGDDNLNDYLASIFENTDNLSRLELNTSSYMPENSSIKSTDIPIPPYSIRPLIIAHWTGVFPFIEYFTYKLPNNMFKLTLKPNQDITINKQPTTYKPIFLYGAE